MNNKKNKDEGLQTPEKKVPQKNTKKDRLVITNHCKNCGNPLNLDQRFCPSCGAKRILNRLTARNLIEDFSERFLNLENAFLKTFIALWTTPDDVINGYIQGLRKKYMSAFSYFAVALTVGSIYIFIFRNWFIDDALGFNELFTDGYQIGGDGSAPSTQMNQTVFAAMREVIDLIFDYNSLFSFVFVPFYALISKMVFWNYKQVNFIEHIVIYLYAYSHTQIITSVVPILLGWSMIGQIIANSLVSVLPFFYTAYVLYKVFDLDIERLILKTLLFLAILFPFSIMFFAILGGGMYALGVFDPFIDGFKEQVEAIKAAKSLKDSIATQDSIRLSVEKVKDTVEMVKTIKDSLR